ncbi:MAG: hypothetical protein LLG20_05820 [Acidobacteriales bacterium]|nr:hypothetical protein [Terriglobales bacterium]
MQHARMSKILLSLSLAILPLMQLYAGTFGKVVPIRGHVSDIALDSRRGLLYAANYTTSRVEVVSLAEQKLLQPIYVERQPGSLALSPDGRFLVVTQIQNFQSEYPAGLLGVTIVDLEANTKATVALDAPPLAVAFGGGSKALVVTTKDFRLLDPVARTMETLRVADLITKELPVPLATFPPEIIQASTGVSGDGQIVYVIAEAPDGTAAVVRYHVVTRSLGVVGILASPPLGPRVISVDQSGNNLLGGWALMNSSIVQLAQFPYPTGKYNTGGHVFDLLRNVVYAQIPVGTGTTTASDNTTVTAEGPVLHVVDTDNLTVRERIRLPENLAGRSLMSPDMQTMYSVSDSGVLILPVGKLGQTPRVVSVQEDALFLSSGCDQRVMTQDIDIVDPGGGSTDFSLSVSGQGVRVVPSSGVTPARVRIEVDPATYQNAKGTTTVQLSIASNSAVNSPLPVRLLINTRDPDQRGAILNIPGKLVDILADPNRNRFYVLRQDKNHVLVYDANGLNQVAALRTGNTPTQMAMTRDGHYLMVANDNSQIATVHDLDALTPAPFIAFPPGHYPRSIAASSNAILATVRSVTDPLVGCGSPHTVDRINLSLGTAAALPTLGIYCNGINEESILTASPSGAVVLLADPTGNVALYEAASDAFVVSRKDLSSLGGAYAALTDDLFIGDNNVLNTALVPQTALETGTGLSSGFTSLDGYGLRATSPGMSNPGVLQRVDLTNFTSIRPTKLIESPVLAKGLETPTVGQIGQRILPFTRSLAIMPNQGLIFALSTSGAIVLPYNYDEAVAVPVVTGVTNLADGTSAVAPGGLIAISGQNLSPDVAVSGSLPLPTVLGSVCVRVDSTPIPLIRVSQQQINGQLPFDTSGSASMVVRNAGGQSGPFGFSILPNAVAVFHSGTAGPNTGLPTIIRVKNEDLVTVSNPIHPDEMIIIYATGLGQVSPEVAAGAAAPSDPLAQAVVSPTIALGETQLTTTFAGLVPGQAGVYQINAYVPRNPTTGVEVPLKITQGTYSTTLLVRVVDP